MLEQVFRVLILLLLRLYVLVLQIVPFEQRIVRVKIDVIVDHIQPTALLLLVEEHPFGLLYILRRMHGRRRQPVRPVGVDLEGPHLKCLIMIDVIVHDSVCHKKHKLCCT